MSSTEDARDDEAQGGGSSNDAFVEPPVRRSTYTPPTSPISTAVDAGVPPIHDDDELAAALADDLSRTMTGSIPIVRPDADGPLDDPFASLFGTQDPPTAPTPIQTARPVFEVAPEEQPSPPVEPAPRVDAPPVFEIPVVDEPAAFAAPPVFEIPVTDDTSTPAFNPPIFEPPVFGDPAPEFEPTEFAAPAFDSPANDERVPDVPVFEVPPFEVPAYEAPTYETPAFDAPTATTPANESPASESPVDEPAPFNPPVFESPAYEIPAYEPPVFEPPVFEAPVAEAPGYEAPAYEAPAFEAPAFEAPAFEVPVDEAPNKEAPAYEAPAYEAPAYDAPASEAPAYDAPAYAPPAFDAPAPPFGAPVGEQPTAPPPFDPSAFPGPVVFPSAEEQAAQLASLSAHAAPAGKPWVPERKSLPDSELMQILQEATGTDGAAGAMQRLEEQMRLRQEEAQEYSDWEQSMLAVGTPEALAAVDGVRPQFTGIIPRRDDAPASSAYEAPAAAPAPSPEPPVFAPPAPTHEPFAESLPVEEPTHPAADFDSSEFAEAVTAPADDHAASVSTPESPLVEEAPASSPASVAPNPVSVDESWMPEAPVEPAPVSDGWQPSAWEPPVDDWTPPASDEPAAPTAEDSDDDFGASSESVAEPVGAFATGAPAGSSEPHPQPEPEPAADQPAEQSSEPPASPLFGDASPFAWAQSEPIVPPALVTDAAAAAPTETFAEPEPAPERAANPFADPEPAPEAPADPFAELFATSPTEPAPAEPAQTEPAPAEPAELSSERPAASEPTADFWADPSASAHPEPSAFVPPTLVEPPEARSTDQGIPAPWFVPQPPVDAAVPETEPASQPSQEQDEAAPTIDSLFEQALAAEQPSPFTVEEPPAPAQADPSSAEQVETDAAASVADDATAASSPLDFDSLLGGGDPAAPIFVEPRPFQSSQPLSTQEEVAQPAAAEPEPAPELVPVIVPEADQAPTGPDPAAVPEPAVVASAPAKQKVFSPEVAGVEPTPADYRVGRAARLFWLWFAANSSIVSIAFGAVLFSLGMSLRQSIIATVAGVALSFLPLGLGTLAGKRSGQPTMVVSRATFGVLGNVVPAIIGLLTRLFWGAALLWLLAASVASILVGAGVDGGLGFDTLVIIGIGAGFVLAVIIAYFGYALIAWLQLVVSIVSGILIVGITTLTWQYIDIPNALTTRDGSWMLVATGAVLVFSFVGLVWANSSSDLARYQRPGSSGAASMLWAPLGTTIPTFLLIAYGALLAASNAQIAAGLAENPLDTIGRLLPVWYPVPLIAATALGLLSGVVVSIYSGGFALQAVGARMPRSVSALVTGVLLVALAFGLSTLDLDLTALFRDVATTLAVPVAAWVGIFAAETMIRNRRYDTASLLRTGGVYPTVHWINLPALFVVTGIGFGLTTANVVGLGWQGYLFSVLGVDLPSDLAGSDIGVLVALVLGLLVPIVAGIPAIRRQESTPGLAN